MSWENGDMRETVLRNLESVGLDKSPEWVYKDEVQDILKDYKDMLEDNTFHAEINEPRRSGVVSGEVSVSLEVEGFKLPEKGADAYGDEIKNQLVFHISAKEDKVTAKGEFGEGEKEEVMSDKTYNNFSQTDVEVAVSNFNEKLMRRVQ